jgi:hypothetical protein
MITTSQDNTEIYYLLEKNQQLPSVFSIDKVIAFNEEDDFCVVFFSAETRNFISFTAKDYLQIVDSLPNLLNEIMDHLTNKFHPTMIDEAIKCVENKMNSKNNSRFFFDAH